jgi:molecular chaperone GrpE
MERSLIPEMSNEENKEKLDNSEETMPNEEEMIEEIVEEAAEEVEDDLERVHADFDNIKKRLEREKYQALEYAQEKFAKDLIPVVDSLEMAIKATEAEETEPGELLAKVKEGVELTMKQFLSALEKHGITPVGEEEPFDPNVHHAVQQVDSEAHESGEIVNTFQKGYKYKERTLRDAMVVIAN